MKKLYINAPSTLLSLAVALLLAACSSNLSYNEALQRNVKAIEDTDKLEDARFLLEAASFNMLARKMAEAALESGYSAAVVSMARENLEEHQEMAKELRRLARREDVVLPGEMNSEHERILAELTSASRREFDRTYIRLLMDISEEDMEKFARMATEAESEDIRAFAARKLDLFESHQEHLQTVDAGLLQTY